MCYEAIFTSTNRIVAGITEIKHKVEEEEIAHHPEMNISFSLPVSAPSTTHVGL